MRTVTYGGAISLDGFLAGPDGALDWLHFSQDVQQITGEYWKTVDTLLMGRKTYDAAVRQRPRRKPRPAKRKAASAPTMRTFVFSRTLTAIDDPDVHLVTTDPAAFVRDLKQGPGRDICLMGGGELAQALIAAGLVDKVGFNIHPVLLGSGIPAFRDPGRRVALTLAECRRLDGGCILASYDVRKIEA
jgi:dihydrofolate reductase